MIGLAAGIYGGKGRIILFFATLVVLFVIVATLLRWIEQLGKFGRVGDTIRRVEQATLPAFRQAGKLPRLGARPLVAKSIEAGPIYAERCGIIVHIDVARLDEIAKENNLAIHLSAMPGSLVHPSRPIMHVHPMAADGVPEHLRSCVTVEDDREFEQDPCFGVIVLSEIASRALSPAVNDPGTAIEVLGAGLRVFLAFADADEEPDYCPFGHVHAPDLDVHDLFLSFFNPITRDGAALAEVQLRVLAVLEALAGRSPTLFGAAASRHAGFVAEQARRSLAMEHDRALVVGQAEALLGG
ncbi:putative membrane protein DUF2254 [Sphingobium sp. AEW010]|nr:putative membrane protein [Sphingobium sp. JAI105]TWC96174.1 putative membrane protein DUF2254 [Sphingobium sp. AEW010]TWD15139.1 putative membrane protein DUF2254 [Sphingobium sp. AEW013]TWD19177.1 putative membrane protein DUF2254 [Sphingobium sp. AEW001]